MKTLNILTALLLGFCAQTALGQSHWTFYSHVNYKGNNKAYEAGEQHVSQWNWNSWKTDCCVKIYYHTLQGKLAEKTLCGEVRDFKSELKQWKNLKYGAHAGWKNIQRIKMYCDNQPTARNSGPHSNQNAHPANQNYQANYRGNENKGRTPQKSYPADQKQLNNNVVKKDFANQAWYKHYGKGNVILAADYHYEGQYKAQATGSFDHRSLKFYPKSIIVSKSGRYVVVEYQDNYHRRKSFVLKEDVPDLAKYMSAHLKVGSEYKNEPYKAITKISIMRY